MQPCREGLKVMLFNSYYVFLKSICLLLFRNLMVGNWFHTTVKVEILAFWHSYMKLKAILHVSSIFVDLHNFSNFGVTKFGMPYIVIILVPDTRNRVLEQKIILSSNLQKKCYGDEATEYVVCIVGQSYQVPTAEQSASTPALPTFHDETPSHYVLSCCLCTKTRPHSSET